VKNFKAPAGKPVGVTKSCQGQICDANTQGTAVQDGSYSVMPSAPAKDRGSNLDAHSLISGSEGAVAREVRMLLSFQRPSRRARGGDASVRLVRGEGLVSASRRAVQCSASSRWATRA
jgi:hypothetical protein